MISSYSDISSISDDVITLVPAESFESIAMTTAAMATTDLLMQNIQNQPQYSPRSLSSRPWTTSQCSTTNNTQNHSINSAPNNSINPTDNSSNGFNRSCQQLSSTNASIAGRPMEYSSPSTNSSITSRYVDVDASRSRAGPTADGMSRVDLVESLSREVEQLKSEMNVSKATISRLHEREKRLRDRLSEQAQRQLEKGTTKFEDICLGDNRPTQLIKRYGNLYSESRLEAMDALDDLEELMDCDDLKVKLLLSVVVLAFRTSQRKLQEMRNKFRDLLYIPSSSEHTSSQHRQAARELEDSVSVYLRKTVDRHDITVSYEEVCERVWATLFDYPSLRQCPGLLRYISDCVRLSWALTVQNPPLVIDYESKVFDPDVHTRFHASDAGSDVIRTVLWPMLTEGENGPCVCKGVVLT